MVGGREIEFHFGSFKIFEKTIELREAIKRDTVSDVWKNWVLQIQRKEKR